MPTLGRLCTLHVKSVSSSIRLQWLTSMFQEAFTEISTPYPQCDHGFPTFSRLLIFDFFLHLLIIFECVNNHLNVPFCCWQIQPVVLDNFSVLTAASGFVCCARPVRIEDSTYWSQRLAEYTGRSHRQLFDETLEKAYLDLYKRAAATS